MLDLWSHESSEPPSHNFGPQSWVNDVEGFEVLLVSGRRRRRNSQHDHWKYIAQHHYQYMFMHSLMPLYTQPQRDTHHPQYRTPPTNTSIYTGDMHKHFKQVLSNTSINKISIHLRFLTCLSVLKHNCLNSVQSQERKIQQPFVN